METKTDTVSASVGSRLLVVMVKLEITQRNVTHLQMRKLRLREGTFIPCPRLHVEQMVDPGSELRPV